MMHIDSLDIMADVIETNTRLGLSKIRCEHDLDLVGRPKFSHSGAGPIQ